MLIQNLVILLAIIGLVYGFIRLSSRMGEIKVLSSGSFALAILLIVVVLLSTIFFYGSSGWRGLFLGWLFIVCLSISIYCANNFYRTLRRKGVGEPLAQAMGLICFVVVAAIFATIAGELFLKQPGADHDILRNKHQGQATIF